jgi:hypothetical protein
VISINIVYRTGTVQLVECRSILTQTIISTTYRCFLGQPYSLQVPLLGLSLRLGQILGTSPLTHWQADTFHILLRRLDRSCGLDHRLKFHLPRYQDWPSGFLPPIPPPRVSISVRTIIRVWKIFPSSFRAWKALALSAKFKYGPVTGTDPGRKNLLGLYLKVKFCADLAVAVAEYGGLGPCSR